MFSTYILAVSSPVSNSHLASGLSLFSLSPTMSVNQFYYQQVYQVATSGKRGVLRAALLKVSEGHLLALYLESAPTNMLINYIHIVPLYNSYPFTSIHIYIT